MVLITIIQKEKIKKQKITREGDVDMCLFLFILDSSRGYETFSCVSSSFCLYWALYVGMRLAPASR